MPLPSALCKRSIDWLCAIAAASGGVVAYDGERREIVMASDFVLLDADAPVESVAEQEARHHAAMQRAHEEDAEMAVWEGGTVLEGGSGVVGLPREEPHDYRAAPLGAVASVDVDRVVERLTPADRMARMIGLRSAR